MLARRSRNVAFVLATIALGTFAGCKETTKDTPPADKASTETNKNGQNEQIPSPFPSDLVKAWTGAKAIPGWMRLEEGEVVHSLYSFQPGDLPAFGFTPDTWNEEVIAKLPAPDVAFGIALIAGVVISPKGTKALARFDNLQLLSLISSSVRCCSSWCSRQSGTVHLSEDF